MVIVAGALIIAFICCIRYIIRGLKNKIHSEKKDKYKDKKLADDEKQRSEIKLQRRISAEKVRSDFLERQASLKLSKKSSENKDSDNLNES